MAAAEREGWSAPETSVGRDPGRPQATSDRTPTVAGAVRDAGDEPVLVTVLVDGVLRRHPPDGSGAEPYLRDRPTRAPAWPTDGPTQPGDAWAREAAQLLRGGEPMFGRIAVVAWCLLDDAVAAEAEGSGVLGALAAETTPTLADHLSPAGVELLRRRAPLVALQEGLLDPAVDLPLDPDHPARLLALHRAPTNGRGVGRWALATDGSVSVGLESGHERVYPSSGESVDAAALGWWRPGMLWVALAHGPDGGLVRWDPLAGLVRALKPPWPVGLVAAVGGDRMALAPGLESGGVEVLWGNTGDAHPEPLPPLDGSPRELAVSGDWTGARIADGSVRLFDASRVNGTWVPVEVQTTSIAQQEETCWFGTASGEVGSVTAAAPAPARVAPVLPGEQIDTLRAGGSLLVVSSSRSVAVLRDGTLVARWSTGTPPVVAVSADGDCLGTCTDGRLRIWRVDAEPELRLTDYLADTVTGDDLLGIGPTVDTLAAVICAHVVTPPLSIGLFGSWGSGKSFFMERLHGRVEQITQQARDSGRSQPGLWAWRNVRQVRFNAWHYASADVWAGMLEQLIAGVRLPWGVPVDGRQLPTELASLQRDRLTRLAAAEAQVRERRAALEAAESQGGQQLLEMVDVNTELLTTKLDQVGLKVGTDLRTTLTQVSAAREAFRQAGWPSGGTVRQTVRTGLTVVGVSLAVLAVMWLLVRTLDPGAEGWGPVTALASGAAGAATWVADKARTYRTNLEAVTTAQRLLEEAVARVETVRAETEPATVGKLLGDYLEGRANSDDYRSQLGLIGTVHRDLRTMSEAVSLNNRDLLDASTPSTAEGTEAVNRVVLYIDDLDRCSPQTVVKVLEAVSMLLSFELFVVVVAVDAHWVSKSLATVYPTLLSGSEVTAENYLEKIFQLPVWLDRPPPEVATAMARRLLGGTDEEQPEEGLGETDRAPGREPTGATSSGSGETGPVMTTPGPSPTGGAVFLATSPPASVGLEKSEVSAVAGLAPMMARSPRTLKRYINTYRLIKGLVEESDLEAARLLLAIATGRPAVGERLLVQVGTTDHHTLGELVDAWPEADRTWLKDSVPAELRTWPTWEMAKVRPAARAVWRFVFRSVPAENGWRRMPGGPAGARPGASAGPQLRVSAGRTRP